MNTDDVSACNLKRHGMRKGVCDGARKRRFVLFKNLGNGNESRSEYDTKTERDNAARRWLKSISGVSK